MTIRVFLLLTVMIQKLDAEEEMKVYVSNTECNCLMTSYRPSKGLGFGQRWYHFAHYCRCFLGHGAVEVLGLLAHMDLYDDYLI